MLNLPLCHWSSQLFDLRAPSSTDVPVLLLNKPITYIIILVIKQIGLPLRGRPILLITRMITDRIGLHSVLLPLLRAQTKKLFSPFRILIFLFLSCSACGIKTINTFIYSPSSLKNHSRFQTKTAQWGGTYTVSYTWGGTYTVSYLESYTINRISTISRITKITNNKKFLIDIWLISY